MKPYHPPYALDRVPAVAKTARIAAIAAVAATLGAALATAGPGNGYQPPQQWAAAHRQDVARVKFPRVEVVGQTASAAHSVAAVACPKGSS